jgi:HD-GYP domain-containing protein (c-di-GMP phosphodiesterase class II)
VAKLFLKVSDSLPELPGPVMDERSLNVKRVKRFTRPSGEGLTAYLLDRELMAAAATQISSAGLAPGCLLFWNPRADHTLPEGIPEELIYEEVLSLKHPQLLLRSLRNLYRRQFLERELARKEERLARKETENEQLLQIGIALSAERENDKLLSYIVQKTREIAVADAGTLYLVEKDEATGTQRLRFKISQNDSNPTDFTEFVVPLSKKAISGYVASTGTVLNIEDAYEIPADREYGFNKSYDLSTGYRTKSMLTVPMQDHKGEILGVIQLINRKRDPSLRLATMEEAEKHVIPFTKDIEPVVLSLASQAAVSLENNNLYQEIERLFEGFVQASVKAIEARDPTTSGHSNRVALYTVSLAQVVDKVGTGAYRDVNFSREQLKEIRYASLLHDFGKVGVREHVLVKAKKLYPQQMELVKMRYAFMRKAMLYAFLKERFSLLSDSGPEAFQGVRAALEAKEAHEIGEIDRYLKTIMTADEPTVLAEEPSNILDEIIKKTFIDMDGSQTPFLAEDEYIKLKVKKGSLDESERKEIESHVTHTYKFLSTIPWTKEMRDIPAFAYGHHEKLDGQGYPRQVGNGEIPIQTRMMTVSDIYDALTASDRPYKRAVPAQKALDILSAEVDEKKLDADLVKLFVDAKIWQLKLEPPK